MRRSYPCMALKSISTLACMRGLWSTPPRDISFPLRLSREGREGGARRGREKREGGREERGREGEREGRRSKQGGSKGGSE